MVKNADFYAKCYFSLRRFPLGLEFYESKEYKELGPKNAVDDYCIKLMRNDVIKLKVEQDFKEALIE